jgi:hypothetical protein
MGERAESGSGRTSTNTVVPDVRYGVMLGTARAMSPSKIIVGRELSALAKPIITHTTPAFLAARLLHLKDA